MVANGSGPLQATSSGQAGSARLAAEGWDWKLGAATVHFCQLLYLRTCVSYSRSAPHPCALCLLPHFLSFPLLVFRLSFSSPFPFSFLSLKFFPPSPSLTSPWPLDPHFHYLLLLSLPLPPPPLSSPPSLTLLSLPHLPHCSSLSFFTFFTLSCLTPDSRSQSLTPHQFLFLLFTQILP